MYLHLTLFILINVMQMVFVANTLAPTHYRDAVGQLPPLPLLFVSEHTHTHTTINKVFINCKLLSGKTVLSMHTPTQACVHTQALACMSTMYLIYKQVKQMMNRCLQHRKTAVQEG